MKAMCSFYTLYFSFKRSAKTFVTVFVCLLCIISTDTINAQINEAARYEINAKRIGVNPSDKDALPRSREFIRLDSTYYVGWMYEGLYKYDRSSDYIGYKQAITPLYKAWRLFEKDYGFKLKNIYSSFDYFNKNASLFNDFFEMANTLEKCYNSIEMPDSTMALLDKVESYHFQRDFFSIGSRRAWLYHRNRFYNSAKFPFLKNSIKENEQLGFQACYEQIEAIKKNKVVNDYWYGPYQSEDDLLTVYHYLALLHDYNRNYDSSQYYYQILIDGGRVLWSNYANEQHVLGNFAEALNDYSKDQEKEKFALNESDYYMPMLLVYAGQTKMSVQMAQNKITQSGSTPGFGWYNIALARGYLYDGQLDSCDFFLTKASNFKELHINTTLTQSLYEFTINLLRIQLIEKRITLIKFFNTGWWYSISDLYEIYSLKSQKLIIEYALVNALSNNPERDRIVYELFCTETTVTYDESMYLLKDFCLPYFEKKYVSYSYTDPRKKINRYFRLFDVQFLLEDGKTEEASKESEKLFKETIAVSDLQNPDENVVNINYEKLYAYRLLEVMARSTDKPADYDSYINKCFEAYPQLMLFSGMPVKMNITFQGLQNDEVIQDIIDELKDCDIELTHDSYVPQAEVRFVKKGETYQATLNVFDGNNHLIVSNGELLFKKGEGIGKELAMRLFAKGGAVKL